MHKQITVSLIVIMSLTAIGTIGWSVLSQLERGNNPESVYAGILDKLTGRAAAAPIAISGDTVYIAWPSNKTGNDEIMFRVSNDSGTTFADKMNLSNTTANSQDAEIAADGDNVIITWWERNQTAEEPVLRMSSDSGATFGPLLKLATNGTLGQAAAEE
jgi:hypothetical protein